MVLRPTDNPRTVPEHVRATRARTDDLGRAMGRGAGALRNRTHALYLDPASANPLLTPTRVDSGILFGDSAVELVGGDGTGYRDLASGGIDARGQVRADSHVSAGGNMNAQGAVSAAGNTVVASASGINAGPLCVATKLQAAAGGITSSGNIGGVNLGMSNYIDDGLGNVRNGAQWSSAALKQHIEPFVDSLDGRRAGDVLGDLDLITWTWNPDTAPFLAGLDGGRAAGFTLEQLAAAAPDFVVASPPDLRPRDDDYIGPQPLDQALDAQRPAPGPTFREDHIRTLLIATLQEQRAELRDLRARVHELAQRLDADGQP